MNIELLNVSNWIKENSLSLNVQKTVYLLFSVKKPQFNIPILNLYDSQILRKSETKFLGRIINDKLSGKPHVNFMKSKIFMKLHNINFLF